MDKILINFKIFLFIALQISTQFVLLSTRKIIPRDTQRIGCSVTDAALILRNPFHFQMKITMRCSFTLHRHIFNDFWFQSCSVLLTCV